MTKKNTEQLDGIISDYRGKVGGTLSILEETQELHPNKYLPEETLKYISLKTKVSLSKIYSIATFYSFFNLKPQGEHTIVVCRGTACHTRGSRGLLDYLKSLLNVTDIEEDENIPITTSDRKFTIRTVACLGQCALAPAVVIDGKIHSHVTREKLRREISRIKTGRKGK